MAVYILNEDQKSATLELLKRTTLKGDEVNAFNAIVQLLNTPVELPAAEGAKDTEIVNTNIPPVMDVPAE